MKNAASEDEVRGWYQDCEVAKQYIEHRFASELGRLLHDRQVCVVNRVSTMYRQERVLEIAPGPARLTQDVRMSGMLVCVEYNQPMIAVGRRACNDRTQWVRGNAFALPVQGPFDLVYSFRFIRHFRRPDRFRLYKQISRVLRPGGYLLLDAVNGRVSGPLRRAHTERYSIYDKLYRDQRELCQELEEARFEVMELESVQRCYRTQYQAQVLLGPRSAWLARLVIRCLERLSWGPGLEWIVTCRRDRTSD